MKMGPFSLVTLSLKFMFPKKATKIDEFFTVDLTLCSKCQIDGEDIVNYCGLLRKYGLYLSLMHVVTFTLISDLATDYIQKRTVPWGSLFDKFL